MGLFRPNIEKMDKAGDTEGLLKCLQHRNSDVKIEAFKALTKKISDKRIHDELWKMMDDKDSDVVTTAVLTFYDLGENVEFSKLSDIMQVATKNQKIQVLEIIEEKCKPGNTEISAVLIQALNDRDIIVAKHAIKTIGKLKNTHAISYLAHRLNEKSYNLRMMVVEALQSIGGDQVVDALISALMDSNHEVRNTAENALKRIGTDKALKALNDSSFLVILKGMSDMETVRIETIQHIRNLKIAEALGLLHKACFDKFKDVRIEALRAISAFGNKESLPSIEALLQDKFFDVRLEAVKALENFPYPETLELLEKVFEDANSSVKNEAKLTYDLLKKKIKS